MKNNFLLNIISFLAMLIAAVIALYNPYPDYYSLLPFLPFTLAVVSFIAKVRIGRYDLSVSSILIFGMTFIRYAIIPLLMAYGNQYTIMKKGIATNANSGILLMIYECVSIYVAVAISYRKGISAERGTHVPYFNNSMFKIVCILSLYCVGIIIMMPDILNNYMTIFDLNKDEFTHSGRLEIFEVGSGLRIFRTLYSVVFNVVRIFLPIYIVGKLAQKSSSDFFVLFVVLLFVFLEFMMITATFAESIVSALVILLAVSKIRGSIGKKIVKFAPLAVIGIIFGYFYVRYQVNINSPYGSMYAGGSTIEYICATVNAYFTGIDNVAATFNLPSTGRWSHFWSSMQITIPFNTTIFGVAGESTPTLFNAVNGTMGQIPSTVGNGAYYFTPIFAPFFSFFFAFYSIRFGLKSQLTPSYWKYICYIFFSIVLSLGLGMYNEVIALGWINGWGIPMLLFVWLAERRTIKA